MCDWQLWMSFLMLLYLGLGGRPVLDGIQMGHTHPPHVGICLVSEVNTGSGNRKVSQAGTGRTWDERTKLGHRTA